MNLCKLTVKKIFSTENFTAQFTIIGDILNIWTLKDKYIVNLGAKTTSFSNTEKVLIVRDSKQRLEIQIRNEDIPIELSEEKDYYFSLNCSGEESNSAQSPVHSPEARLFQKTDNFW